MKPTYVLEARPACPGVQTQQARANKALRQRAVSAAALALAALALLSLVRTGPAASLLPAGSRAPMLANAAAAVAAPQQAVPAALQSEPAAQLVSPPADPAVPGQWVQQVDAGISIEAHAVPRRALVEQLAAATGTLLIGSTAGLDATPAVTLRWQGRDLAALWAALLDGRANFAAQCDGRTCKLWLLGAPAPHTAAQRTAASTPAPRVSEQLQPDPPGLFPAE
jgi:hypothetical protein